MYPKITKNCGAKLKATGSTMESLEFKELQVNACLIWFSQVPFIAKIYSRLV